MASVSFIGPFTATPNCNSVQTYSGFRTCNHRIVRFPVSSRPIRFASFQISQSHSSSSSTDEEEEEEGLVQDLRVPEQWLEPSKALEKSEWLRVNLHKWLDDEYCPEPTNVEISNVAACSFYESLVQRQTDLGEILLKMAGELESISYQESFHGAFSSANAAVNLIIQRLERD